VATLNPFRGLRYDPARVPDQAAVVAPPYDVIDAGERDRLYARAPYNAVRLICNRAGDPYADAARTLAAWRRGGVLHVDAAPTLYLYAQRFPTEGGPCERVGVIGALRLEPADGSTILGHERTRAHAVSDRRRLLEACATALSPIFGLVSSPGWGFATLVPERAPDVDVTDDAATRHRVWRLVDPAVIEAVTTHCRGRHVFIADGHHRFETALDYARAMRRAAGASAPAPGTAGYDYTLGYLTTLEDPGLVVLPTHRTLARLPVAPDAVRAAVARWFAVTDLPWNDDGVARLRAWLGAPRPDPGALRIGIAARAAGKLWMLAARAEDLPFDAATPPELRALDVTALHEIVLGRGLGLPVTGAPEGLAYTQDAAAALAAVASGAASAAFLLPATDLAAIRDVSLAGLSMPAKSTFFHPKLLTGLVFYPHDTPEESREAAAAR